MGHGGRVSDDVLAEQIDRDGGDWVRGEARRSEA
jgi:hypothetical protein